MARVFTVRQPTATALALLAAGQEDCELTYPGRGATAGAGMPAGYARGRWDTDLGPLAGPDQFDRLAAALLGWQVQRDSGIMIVPDTPARPGQTFALAFRLPAGGWVTGAGRVVYVTSEPGRRGFAYGTLPAHPERGEESFHLVTDGTRLRFEVRAFSRPAHPAARLGAPVTRLLALRMNRAYLRSMKAAAARR